MTGDEEQLPPDGTIVTLGGAITHVYVDQPRAYQVYCLQTSEF